MGGSSSSPPSLESRVTCNTWVVLECCCPAAGCDNDDEVKWAHAACGKVIEINSQAFLRCSMHGVNCTMADAAWSCSKHQGDYRQGDHKSIIHALTIAASLRPKTEKEWCKRLIRSAAELS
jgi:hypothetical protein